VSSTTPNPYQLHHTAILNGKRYWVYIINLQYSHEMQVTKDFFQSQVLKKNLLLLSKGRSFIEIMMKYYTLTRFLMNIIYHRYFFLFSVCKTINVMPEHLFYICIILSPLKWFAGNIAYTTQRGLSGRAFGRWVGGCGSVP